VAEPYLVRPRVQTPIPQKKKKRRRKMSFSNYIRKLCGYIGVSSNMVASSHMCLSSTLRVRGAKSTRNTPDFKDFI
jgi:hypothetical protein